MIDFDRFVLPNGMKVLVHRDTSSPLATFNIMYNVGSRDENPQKTGFAHLFEHLMFEGTQNVPDFDGALYLAGGESNAYTNADTTDYYLTLPSANLETAFWLESDRMQSLSLTESVFNTARQVVIEEFNQRYLNQPYGDIWLQLRPLAYRIHPYRWPTIGASIDHLLHAELDDVQEFYRRFYVPNNAVMAVCGDVTTDQVYRWSEKWFAPIPARKVMRAGRHPEPEQMEYRRLDIDRDVPSDAIYKVYHTGGRLSADFRAADFLSDVLDAGKSSRLYQHLVQEKRLFSDIQAYVTGEEEPGLLVISGKLTPGIRIDEAEEAIDRETDELAAHYIPEPELEKLKNKFESNLIMSHVSVMQKAMSLCYYETLQHAGLIQSEIERYKSVSSGELCEAAGRIFSPENASVVVVHRR